MQLPIEVRFSTRYRLIARGGGIVLLGTGVLLLHNGQVFEGVLVTLFGLGGAIASTLPRHRIKPHLTLTAEGISGRLLRGVLISWDHIENAWVRHVLGYPYLCLRLKHPEAYTELGQGSWIWFLTRGARIRLFGNITLGFEGLAPSAREVAVAVNERVRSGGVLG